ncbi:MAG: GNAT family N-acetyltransferase [Microthrixaceae bacterium]
MLIRPAELADAPAILDIYNHEVQTSVVTFDLVPRTLAEQEEWIGDRSGAHAVLVAVDDDPDGTTPEAIAGFGALSPYRDRPGYSTTVEDSVYVHRDHRGNGVGRLLLAELVETARAHGFHAMMAKVVGGHEASITLHAAAGFEVVGHEREVGRKFGRWLDVVVMERLL